MESLASWCWCNKNETGKNNFEKVALVACLLHSFLVVLVFLKICKKRNFWISGHWCSSFFSKNGISRGMGKTEVTNSVVALTQF